MNEKESLENLDNIEETDEQTITGNGGIYINNTTKTKININIKKE